MQSCMRRGVPGLRDELLLVVEALVELPAEVRLVLAPERVLLGLVVKVESGDLLLWTNGG